MTDPGTTRPAPAAGHEAWAELAVAYALGALDPADAERTAAHLATCAACRAEVAETSAAMAELATALPAVPFPAGLRDRVLAAAVADPPRAAGSGGPAPTAPVDLAARRRRARPVPPWLGLAAAVLLFAAVAAGVWALAGSGGGQRSVAERCAAVNCPTVPLVGDGDSTVADVMVLDGTVYVHPAGLPADDAAHEQYVVWRMRPGTPPAAVGSFDLAAGDDGTVAVGRLAVPLSRVRQFAITREPGDVPPPAPGSAPVAVGAVG